MTSRATVVSVDGDFATVETGRMSACEGCHKQTGDGGCSACTLMGGGGKTARTRAINTVGAKPGDSVTVESRSGVILFYCFLVFILPVAVSIGVYFALCGVIRESLALLAAFGALSLCMLGVSVYSRSAGKRRCDAEITGIVSSAPVGPDGSAGSDAAPANEDGVPAGGNGTAGS